MPPDGGRDRPEPAASDARLSLPRLAGRLADPLQQDGRQFADAVLELPAGVPLPRMTLRSCAEDHIADLGRN